VASQRPQIIQVAGEDGTAGLGSGHEDRIDRRSSAGLVAQRTRPSRQGRWKLFNEVAGLEQLVQVRIIALASRSRLHELDPAVFDRLTMARDWPPDRFGRFFADGLLRLLTDTARGKA
jgi:hypothetical protein